jgi:hypothetical protein
MIGWMAVKYPVGKENEKGIHGSDKLSQSQTFPGA